MSDLFNEDAGEVVKFEDLVGAGKKYADPDAAAKKIVHADKHITNLETEMAELRAELQARVTLEAMLDKIQKPAPASTEKVPDTNRQDLGSQNSQVDLAAEVQKLVKAEKDKDKRESNLSSVREELKTRFGPDYNQKLVQIAENLAVTPKFLTDMATSTPQGFLKLIDSIAKPDKDSLGLPNPALDLGRNNQNQHVKNKAYFDNIRKTDLNTYFSRRVQNDMHDQAMKLGPAFYA